ncbi:TIGR01777 family oxidoreductase [Vibrio sp. SA48]
MKILLTGGTGFIGKALIKQILAHDIHILTRNIPRAKEQLKHVDNSNFTYLTSLSTLKDLNQFDAIINLAGEPIADKRWTPKQKKAICASRWEITEQLVELIHASTEPPHVFISGSAVGYYGDQQSHPFDETLHAHSNNFPHQVCAKWEQIALKAQSERTRVCLLRTGIVLATEGGALAKMLPPYKLGLGGPLGSGEQYMPWIHMLDMVRAITYLLETQHAQGAFNLCAPHAVTNKVFSQSLAKTLNRPHLLFTPKWLMNIILGEAAVLLFDSIRAKPKKLTELGFHFQYSHIEPAFKNILKRNL